MTREYPRRNIVANDLKYSGLTPRTNPHAFRPMIREYQATKSSFLVIGCFGRLLDDRIIFKKDH